MGEVWVEKYRPRLLKEVEGEADTMNRLMAIARDGNMPNLLLCGPPGTGKTSSVLALARELLAERQQRALMELNASDDRGVDVVRDAIKSFAKEKIDLPPGRHKIVILDEVDSMTETAQQALRRLMEIYSSTTRFALACNQSTKVIEPIQSRCAILRFGRLQDHQILKRLLHICREEKIDYTDSGLSALIFTAEGDLRNAINNLQSTFNGFGVVNRENVAKVCDVPPPEAVTRIVESCLGSNWSEAHKVAVDLLMDGYTPMDIIVVLKTLVRRSQDIPEVVALEFLKLIARCHYVMADGSDTRLQLDALLAGLCDVASRLYEPVGRPASPLQGKAS